MAGNYPKSHSSHAGLNHSTSNMSFAASNLKFKSMRKAAVPWEGACSCVPFSSQQHTCAFSAALVSRRSEHPFECAFATFLNWMSRENNRKSHVTFFRGGPIFSLETFWDSHLSGKYQVQLDFATRSELSFETPIYPCKDSLAHASPSSLRRMWAWTRGGLQPKKMRRWRWANFGGAARGGLRHPDSKSNAGSYEAKGVTFDWACLWTECPQWMLVFQPPEFPAYINSRQTRTGNSLCPSHRERGITDNGLHWKKGGCLC